MFKSMLDAKNGFRVEEDGNSKFRNDMHNSDSYSYKVKDEGTDRNLAAGMTNFASLDEDNYRQSSSSSSAGETPPNDRSAEGPASPQTKEKTGSPKKDCGTTKSVTAFFAKPPKKGGSTAKPPKKAQSAVQKSTSGSSSSSLEGKASRERKPPSSERKGSNEREMTITGSDIDEATTWRASQVSPQRKADDARAQATKIQEMKVEDIQLESAKDESVDSDDWFTDRRVSPRQASAAGAGAALSSSPKKAWGDGAEESDASMGASNPGNYGITNYGPVQGEPSKEPPGESSKEASSPKKEFAPTYRWADIYDSDDDLEVLEVAPLEQKKSWADVRDCPDSAEALDKDEFPDLGDGKKRGAAKTFSGAGANKQKNRTLNLGTGSSYATGKAKSRGEGKTSKDEGRVTRGEKGERTKGEGKSKGEGKDTKGKNKKGAGKKSKEDEGKKGVKEVDSPSLIPNPASPTNKRERTSVDEGIDTKKIDTRSSGELLKSGWAAAAQKNISESEKEKSKALNEQNEKLSKPQKRLNAEAPEFVPGMVFGSPSWQSSPFVAMPPPQFTASQLLANGPLSGEQIQAQTSGLAGMAGMTGKRKRDELTPSSSVVPGKVARMGSSGMITPSSALPMVPERPPWAAGAKTTHQLNTNVIQGATRFMRDVTAPNDNNNSNDCQSVCSYKESVAGDEALQRRLEQVKVSQEYQAYVKQVPKHERTEDMCHTPSTKDGTRTFKRQLEKFKHFLKSRYGSKGTAQTAVVSA